MKAYILTEFDRDDEAKDEEARAARLRSEEPGDDELYFDAGVWRTTPGTTRRPSSCCRKLIVRGSNSPEVYAIRASAYEELGDTGRAIEDYSHLRKASIRRSTTTTSISDACTPRAMSWTRARASSAVRWSFEPGSAVAHENLSDNFLEQGREAVYAGEDESALGHFEQAEGEARKALELKPDLRWASVNLGASLLEQHRVEGSPDTGSITEAVRHFEQATAGWQGAREGPAFAVYFGALNNTCDAHIELRNLPRALEVCSKVVELDPQNAIPHYNLAGVHALSGRPDDAFVELEKDVELGDTDWVYLEDDPWFESLRSDPRFTEIIDGMKRAASEP